MKKTIKTISIIAIITVSMTAVLAGCTGNKPETTTPAETETTGFNVEVETNESGDTIGAGEGGPGVDIEHQSLIDNDDCSVVITGINPNDPQGFAIELSIENRSDEDSLMYKVEYALIEGLSVDPYWAVQISPESTADSKICFYSSDLASYGIDYTHILMKMRVTKADDWSAEAVASELIDIYPYGKENAREYVRAEDGNDEVLVDNDYVRATVVGYKLDDIWGYSAKVYLENKTDKDVLFTAENVTVNGKMIDPYWGIIVPANGKAYSMISWDLDELNSNSITTVDKIGMTFLAVNNEDWAAVPMVQEEITFEP